MLVKPRWEITSRPDYRSSESSRVSGRRLTFDDEVGLRLEVFGSEFDLSGFIQLDIPQSQAVDFTLRLQHHLSGSTDSVSKRFTLP